MGHTKKKRSHVSKVHVPVAMNMNYYHDLEDNKEAAQTFLW